MQSQWIYGYSSNFSQPQGVLQHRRGKKQHESVRKEPGARSWGRISSATHELAGTPLPLDASAVSPLRKFLTPIAVRSRPCSLVGSKLSAHFSLSLGMQIIYIGGSRGGQVLDNGIYTKLPPVYVKLPALYYLFIIGAPVTYQNPIILGTVQTEKNRSRGK